MWGWARGPTPTRMVLFGGRRKSGPPIVLPGLTTGPDHWVETQMFFQVGTPLFESFSKPWIFDPCAIATPE